MIAALTLLLAISPADAGVRRLAVVVGANQGDAADEQLRFAERDAARFAEVLESLGDVPSEDIIVVRRPTAAGFRRVFDTLHARLDTVDPEDSSVVYVYYSGHSDATALRMGGTRLPLDELTGLLQAVPADVRVLVVDACQSGELTRVKGAAPAEPFTIMADDRLDSEGLAIITSSSIGEDAQESDHLGGGIFTHHLVTAMMGAGDLSDDGRVTLTEAYRYAHAQTIRSTSSTRFVQHPSYAFRLSGQEDLVLTRLDDAAHTATLSLVDPGKYLVFGAGRSTEVVAELDVDSPTRVVLQPGPYAVMLREPSEVRRTTVLLTQGATTPLGRSEMDLVAYGATVRKGLSTTKRSAVALTVGAGVLGPVVEGAGIGPATRLGLRIDLEHLTLGTRVAYARQGLTNDTVQLTLDQISADVVLAKVFDAGVVQPSIGVHGGVDVVLQRFTTAGSAPARQGLAGRIGPHLAVDFVVSPRVLVGITGGADVQLYPLLDPITGETRTATHALPHGGLEVTAYVF